MTSLARMLGQQWRGDLRRARELGRARWSDEERAARSHSIEDLRVAARKALPRAVFDYVDGGAQDELAMRRNAAAFRDLPIHPRVLADVTTTDTRTTILGRSVGLPIIGAPTGMTGLIHPAAEVALARAFQAADSVYTLSAMGSYTIQELAEAAPGPLWFQLYVWKDRGFVRELLARAKDARYEALVVTVDGARVGSRERDVRNGFAIPPRITARSFVDGIRCPRWSARFMRHDRASIANLPSGVTFDGSLSIPEFVSRQFDPGVTWDDVSKLRDDWPGPIVIKGIMRADDAALAVGIGADAVVVSNHGGRQLDGTPGTAEALPAIVDAVGSEAEVYVDGGIRRGADVVRALALGAKACMLGRPMLFGLAAAGEAGATRALAILARELDSAMALAGCPSVDQITESVLAATPGSRVVSRTSRA